MFGNFLYFFVDFYNLFTDDEFNVSNIKNNSLGINDLVTESNNKIIISHLILV